MRRILVAVQPELLGLLLTEILQASGEDEVTRISSMPPATPGRPFTAALVSAPCPIGRIAEVVIVLPGPGATRAEVHTGAGVVAVDIESPAAVRAVLDRYCPGPATGDGRPVITAGG